MWRFVTAPVADTGIFQRPQLGVPGHLVWGPAEGKAAFLCGLGPMACRHRVCRWAWAGVTPQDCWARQASGLAEAPGACHWSSVTGLEGRPRATLSGLPTTLLVNGHHVFPNPFLGFLLQNHRGRCHYSQSRVTGRPCRTSGETACTSRQLLTETVLWDTGLENVHSRSYHTQLYITRGKMKTRTGNTVFY